MTNQSSKSKKNGWKTEVFCSCGNKFIIHNLQTDEKIFLLQEELIKSRISDYKLTLITKIKKMSKVNQFSTTQFRSGEAHIMASEDWSKYNQALSEVIELIKKI